VVDYGSPCHSDTAIEKALEGFQIETWDWKKTDLCTDVIWNSTKIASHISLYSSCNNAVLMGWASSDGLGDRKKFPKVCIWFQQRQVEYMAKSTKWNLAKTCSPIYREGEFTYIGRSVVSSHVVISVTRAKKATEGRHISTSSKGKSKP
jgi:hypothetical protein